MSDSIRSSQLIRESVSRRELPRVPEPESIMHDPAQIAAFEEAGREDGILAFIYFFHALQMAPVVRPGDRVLDLACGPANQLVQAARLNPRAFRRIGCIGQRARPSPGDAGALRHQQRGLGAGRHDAAV